MGEKSGRGSGVWRAMGLSMLLLMGLALNPAGAAPSRSPTFGPAPGWVEEHRVTPPAAESGLIESGQSGGRRILLLDRQVRVQGGQQVQYTHVAKQALNSAGLEPVSQVQISFDPSYQQLMIHRAEVVRAGRVVARLQPSALKVLQREANLEEQVFNGSLTAYSPLPDVRVGDVVELVYSITGRNPVYGGAQFGGFDLEWNEPVEQAYARLLWPRERPLHWRFHQGAARPSVTTLGEDLDHRWEASKVPARRVDDDTPAWHDPYRWVEWGEMASWADVARWAQPLYRPGPTTPALERIIKRMATDHADPEQRLLAALRWVQREVRYLGIEIGANSHAPHAPDLVLQRRFGDCKDKTLLTLALLRGLGIPAQAALVHTQLRASIGERLPTPWAFNHVLVRAELPGQAVWLDPTRSPQGGRHIEQVVQADYGLALVVNEASADLVAMAGPQARAFARDVTLKLDASAGYDQPALMTVISVARGESADSLRATLATVSADKLQGDFLNFYSRSYPGLTVERPFEVQDDLDANRLEVIERYRLPRFWLRDDNRPRWNGSVEVPDMMDWLRAPVTVQRQDPLYLRHPVDLTLVSEFTLPSERWAVKPSAQRIEDPTFLLTREESWKGNTLTLRDRYQTKANHVPAADVPRYVANLEKARSALGYMLYRSDPQSHVAGADAPHWLPTLIGALAVLAVLAGAVLLYRWDPQPWPGAAAPGAPAGLWGWLILPVLGLVRGLWQVGTGLRDWMTNFTVGNWTRLTDPESADYHPLWSSALLGELVLNLALLAGSAVLLALMLRRRTSVPRCYIGWILLAWAAALFEAGVTTQIEAMRDAWGPKNWGRLAGAFISGVVWMSYFGLSQRVRATFVRRRKPDLTGPEPPAEQHLSAAPPATTPQVATQDVASEVRPC